MPKTTILLALSALFWCRPAQAQLKPAPRKAMVMEATAFKPWNTTDRDAVA